MSASPLKFVVITLVCGLALVSSPGTAQACWLTDWMWGNDQTAGVAAPVITTNYPVYPATAGYPTVQANYQPAVVGSCPPQAQVTTAGYLPQMNYRSSYQRVPVTVYRPVPVYRPNSAGVPVVGYQGCTTNRFQVQRTPTPGYAAAPAGSTCGCASSGYTVPAQVQAPATITQPQSQPGSWVPAPTQQPPAGYTAPPAGYSVPQSQPQVQPQMQLAPQPGYSSGQGNSIYSTPPTPTAPAGQPMGDANTRPSLRPPLNSSGSTTMQMPAAPAPSINRYIPQPVTSQRPTSANTTSAIPSSTNPAAGDQWKVAPVTPIRDPKFSTSGPSNEAPRLLDPRDKTAGLDQPGLVIPVGFEMAEQPPKPAYKPPTASISVENDGWYSLRK
ncbi:hypothetical protein GC197_09530 [bacterium]|nr:hypothetical protein [bacterium]